MADVLARRAKRPPFSGDPPDRPASIGCSVVGFSLPCAPRSGAVSICLFLGRVGSKMRVKRKDVGSLTGCRLTLKNIPCYRV